MTIYPYDLDLWWPFLVIATSLPAQSFLRQHALSPERTSRSMDPNSSFEILTSSSLEKKLDAAAAGTFCKNLLEVARLKPLLNLEQNLKRKAIKKSEKLRGPNPSPAHLSLPLSSFHVGRLSLSLRWATPRADLLCSPSRPLLPPPVAEWVSPKLARAKPLAPEPRLGFPFLLPPPSCLPPNHACCGEN